MQKKEQYVAQKVGQASTTSRNRRSVIVTPLPLRWKTMSPIGIVAVWLMTMLASVHPVSAFASVSRCTAFFVGAEAPDLKAAPLTARTHVLCFQFYSVLESGVTRTALWSAEHLTRASVASAHGEKRVDAFHTESSIDSNDRAEIADYRASGYDRGHMSPSGDMPDAAAQEESFSLANMVPQAPDNNRHLWQGIEIATRALAKADGELYVVTGPIFAGSHRELDARVEIPSHIWKAIYDPDRGAAAYVTANRPGNGYAVVSITTLTQMTGIDPFPSLPDAVKAKAIALPPPRPSGRRLTTGPVDLAALGWTGDQRSATSLSPFQADADKGDGASDGAAISEGIFGGNHAPWPASEAALFGKVPLNSRLERLRGWLVHFAVAERVNALVRSIEDAGDDLVRRVKQWSKPTARTHAEHPHRPHAHPHDDRYGQEREHE